MPNVESQLADIQRVLGEVLGESRAMRRDFDRERDDAKSARQRVYERIEHVETDLVGKIKHLEETASIAGQTAAQVRDEVLRLDAVITTDVKPQTDKLKVLRLVGVGVFATLGTGFTVLGISVATFGERAWKAFTSFLA